jgi:hypothetical protein
VITNPRSLTAAEMLVLCVLAVLSVVVFLLVRRRNLPFPTLVAVALLATVAVSAPFTADGVINDVRAAHGYSPFRAERVGPEGNGLDTTVVDRIAERIPRHATYAIVIARSAPQDVGAVFRIWALAFLLPRVAVSDPAAADWIVSFGAPPRHFGVRARAVEAVPWRHGPSLTAWVGEVR